MHAGGPGIEPPNLHSLFGRPRPAVRAGGEGGAEDEAPPKPATGRQTWSTMPTAKQSLPQVAHRRTTTRNRYHRRQTATTLKSEAILFGNPALLSIGPAQPSLNPSLLLANPSLLFARPLISIGKTPLD